jgi:hypothetical protein
VGIANLIWILYPVQNIQIETGVNGTYALPEGWSFSAQETPRPSADSAVNIAPMQRAASPGFPVLRARTNPTAIPKAA